MTDDLLTATEAADRLGVTARTIQRWADADRIPHITLPSGHLRIRAEVVTELLTAQP